MIDPVSHVSDHLNDRKGKCLSRALSCGLLIFQKTLFLFAILFLSVGSQLYALDTSEDQEKLVDTARWLFDRKEYELAEISLKKTLSTPGIDRQYRSQSQLLLAGIAQERGQDAESLAYYLGWLDEFPGFPETAKVNFKVATQFRALKAFGRADEYFARSLSAAVALASSESEKKSIAKYQRLAIAAKWELGETRYQAQEWKKAYELFDRFIKQNPEAEDLVQASFYRKADCCYQLGEADNAIKEYQNALSMGPLHPFAPEAWLRLVDLYGRQKEFDKQAASLKSLIWLVKEAHPKDTEYWQQRTADILLQIVQGRPEDAQKLLLAMNQEKNNKEWAPIADFLKGLTGRLVDSYNSGKMKMPVPKKDISIKDEEIKPMAEVPVTASAASPQGTDKTPSTTTPPPQAQSPENQPKVAKTSTDGWDSWKKQLDEANEQIEKRIRALK